MMLDHTAPKIVKVSIITYIPKFIAGFPDKITGVAVAQVTGYLYNI